VDLMDDICVALTGTDKPEQIEKLLDYLKNPEVVRPQDHVRWLIRLLSNRHSRDVAWKWLRDEWSWIEKKFGSDKSYDYYPRYAAMSLRTPKHLDEYTKFFSKMKDNPALKRVIE